MFLLVFNLCWFALNGVLWYLRPPELLWLSGSLILGALYFAVFLTYLIGRDRA